MRKARSPALIIAIILLLLPVLYVGSYLALVTPGNNRLEFPGKSTAGYLTSYRVAGRWPTQFFWPLEQIDRRVRPNAWVPAPVVDPS